MSDSSPPSYSNMASVQPYPHPAHPVFRQRQSATIISIDSPSSSGSDTSLTPTASPSNPASILHDRPPSPIDHDSEMSLGSQMSSPPSFHTIPEHVIHESRRERRNSSTSFAAEEGEATPLLAEHNGTEAKGKWFEGPLFVTAIKFSVLFILFTVVVVGTFWFGLPKLDAEDRKAVKLPRSFADLQAINAIFKKYKTLYPFRLLACGVVSYLFVQTFSLPGSMYISILFGAAYGMVYGLFLSCISEASGALLCYLLSALLGPPLLALPFYRARVETWRVKIMGDPKKGKQVSWDGVFTFLIVLRILPFPPHWVANFVAPHLGIGMFLFFSSVFIGIAPVSVIHVTIGSSLDKMTSADDFHILSVRNVLGLGAIIVAVLIPVGLKRLFRKEMSDLGDAETALAEEAMDTREVDVPAIDDAQPRRYQAVDSGVVLAGPSTGDPNLDISRKVAKGKGRAVQIITDIREDEAEESEHEVYDAGEAHAQTDNIMPRRAYRPVKGYGAIEAVEREQIEAGGPWWTFSRK